MINVIQIYMSQRVFVLSGVTPNDSQRTWVYLPTIWIQQFSLRSQENSSREKSLEVYSHGKREVSASLIHPRVYLDGCGDKAWHSVWSFHHFMFYVLNEAKWEYQTWKWFFVVSVFWFLGQGWWLWENPSRSRTTSGLVMSLTLVLLLSSLISYLLISFMSSEKNPVIILFLVKGNSL